MDASRLSLLPLLLLLTQSAAAQSPLPILEELGFRPDAIYTSLEKRMKCGIGKCGRCNIGPKYVCKDGPVFSLAELHTLPNEL